MNTVPANRVTDGEVLADVILTPQEMAYMNRARENFKQLDNFVRLEIIPRVGGYQSQLGSDLEALLCNVRDLSGQFCWKHRQVGAMHNAREVQQ